MAIGRKAYLCTSCFYVSNKQVNQCPNCKAEFYMKKTKVKNPTKEQQTILQLQTRIDQDAHDIRCKNNEIERLKQEAKASGEFRNKLDSKLQEVRGHVSGALNHARGVKASTGQNDLFLTLGKIQGRLEAAQGYDSYGLAADTYSTGVTSIYGLK